MQNKHLFFGMVTISLFLISSVKKPSFENDKEPCSEVSSSQEVWMSKNLRGRVKSVEKSIYYAYDFRNSGKIEKKDLKSKTIYKYNKNSKLFEEIVYNTNGTLKLKYVYNYDEGGELLNIKRYSGGVIFQSKTKYNYDSSKNLVLETTYTKDSTVRNKISIRP